MKICYLADINNYHTKKWAEFFSSKGNEVIIISMSNGEINGCKSYCFGYTNVKGLSSFKKISYLTYVNRIKQILKEEKPDILHAHYASSYGLLSILSGFKPSVVSLWGSDILLFPKKSFIHKFLISKVLNGKNVLFSTSNYMIEESRKYLKRKKEIHLTPFGVKIDKFKQISKTKRERDSFVVGVNKSLETISGIDILLKATSVLIKDNTNTNTNIEIRIAGKGSQKNSLFNLAQELEIENSVKFLGYLKEDEMAGFLQDLDLAIYPSRSESFGVAAVEAQACGIPVVASNVDGFKESTIPNKTALLFEQGNEHDLRRKIQLLLEDETRRLSMGEKGQEFVERNFDLEQNFKEVYLKYESIINRI